MASINLNTLRSTILELLRYIKYDAKAHGYGTKRGLFSLAYNPSFRLVLNYRLGRFFLKNGFHLWADYLFFQQVYKYSCYVSYRSNIGNNIMFPHPVAIVIGEGAKIGDNVKIWQGVTLGSHGRPEQALEYPFIDDDVKIFAHAQVLGGVSIGRGAVIGANSVVLQDVPPHNVAVGSPARILAQ